MSSLNEAFTLNKCEGRVKVVMTKTLFQTKRLLTRQITHDDLDAMAAVYGDADAMRWVGDGEPLAREGCAEWIEVTHRNYRKRGYGLSAIALRSSGKVIGFCGIVHPGGQPEAEIKYAFLREVWGQGFATETVRGMIAYGSETFGLMEIIATVAPDNHASQRVLTKAGMKHSNTRDNEDGTFTELFVWRANNNSND